MDLLTALRPWLEPSGLVVAVAVIAVMLSRVERRMEGLQDTLQHFLLREEFLREMGQLRHEVASLKASHEELEDGTIRDIDFYRDRSEQREHIRQLNEGVSDLRQRVSKIEGHLHG